MVILEYTYPRIWGYQAMNVWGARCMCCLGDYGNEDPRPFKVYFAGGGYVTKYRFIEMGTAFKALKQILQFRDIVGTDLKQSERNN